jgi:chemotaxis protein methyltransferase CheR
MGRGLPSEMQSRHFTVNGRMWEISEEIKAFVTFRKFNLQEDFHSAGGPFDLVLLRNVAIYFSEEFKKELFEKVAKVMKPDGVLLLGSTESLRGYSEQYQIEDFKGCTFNILK